MKRSADYETDNGVIRVRPVNVDINEKDTGKILSREFAYITIVTTTSKIHINKEYIPEIIDILKSIEERYINQTA